MAEKPDVERKKESIEIKLPIIDIGDIKKIQLVGRGGFGAVYKCKHATFGIVALKELFNITRGDLKCIQNQDPNFKEHHSEQGEAIYKEAQKMFRVVTSQYLVSVMGLLNDPDSLGIVMEFMPNGSLKEFQHNYMGCDCWARKVKMIQDIALGMNYLHSLKPPIIHRDLKLENVFVGDGLEAKIGDLGLAVSSELSVRTANVAGTRSHFPPEASKPRVKPDKFWDAYTFAITTYEFVSGQDAWPQQDEFANDPLVAIWVSQGHRPALDVIQEDAPEELIDLIKKCWVTNPKERPSFKDIVQFLTDLFESKYEEKLIPATIDILAIMQAKRKSRQLNDASSSNKTGSDSGRERFSKEPMEVGGMINKDNDQKDKKARSDSGWFSENLSSREIGEEPKSNKTGSDSGLKSPGSLTDTHVKASKSGNDKKVALKPPALIKKKPKSIKAGNLTNKHIEAGEAKDEKTHGRIAGLFTKKTVEAGDEAKDMNPKSRKSTGKNKSAGAFTKKYVEAREAKDGQNLTIGDNAPKTKKDESDSGLVFDFTSGRINEEPNSSEAGPDNRLTSPNSLKEKYMEACETESKTDKYKTIGDNEPKTKKDESDHVDSGLVSEDLASGQTNEEPESNEAGSDNGLGSRDSLKEECVDTCEPESKDVKNTVIGDNEKKKKGFFGWRRNNVTIGDNELKTKKDESNHADSGLVSEDFASGQTNKEPQSNEAGSDSGLESRDSLKEEYVEACEPESTDGKNTVIGDNEKRRTGFFGWMRNKNVLRNDPESNPMKLGQNKDKLAENSGANSGDVVSEDCIYAPVYMSLSEASELDNMKSEPLKDDQETNKAGYDRDQSIYEAYSEEYMGAGDVTNMTLQGDSAPGGDPNYNTLQGYGDPKNVVGENDALDKNKEVEQKLKQEWSSTINTISDLYRIGQAVSERMEALPESEMLDQLKEQLKMALSALNDCACFVSKRLICFRDDEGELNEIGKAALGLQENIDVISKNLESANSSSGFLHFFRRKGSRNNLDELVQRLKEAGLCFMDEVEKELPYVALQDHEATNPFELSFKKGELLKIQKEGDLNWSAKSIETKEEGSVSRDHIKKMRSIRDELWYFGRIGALEVSRRLTMPGLQQGTFLIRDSTSRAGEYSLSIRDHDEDNRVAIQHYQIHITHKGEFFINPQSAFNAMEGLVEHYQESKHGLCCKLAASCPKHASEIDDAIGDSVFYDELEIGRESLECQKQIRKASFAEVWQGTWVKRAAEKKVTVPVAIEILRACPIQPGTFLNQARVMATLEHKNVVALYGVCPKEETFVGSDNPVYLVREFTVNGCLLGYLREGEGQQMERTEILDVATQIASGMEYLDEQCIIHRLLMAKSVVVGEHKTVKITDLHLAVHAEDGIYKVEEDEIPLPIKWMAPETFEGTFSTKSDVWAFGILLTEIVTHGKIPYPDMKTMEVRNQVMDGHRMQKPEDCPDRLYKIMLDTWDEDAEKRPTFASLQLQLLALKEEIGTIGTLSRMRKFGMHSAPTPQLDSI